MRVSITIPWDALQRQAMRGEMIGRVMRRQQINSHVETEPTGLSTSSTSRSATNAAASSQASQAHDCTAASLKNRLLSFSD